MTPRRRWFHFSLKSLLVMQVVLVGFFWVNASETLGARWLVVSRGWPWTFHTRHSGFHAVPLPPSRSTGSFTAWTLRGDLVILTASTNPSSREKLGLSVPWLLADILTAIAVAGAVGFASERLLFRRKRDSGASEK